MKTKDIIQQDLQHTSIKESDDIPEKSSLVLEEFHFVTASWMQKCFNG